MVIPMHEEVFYLAQNPEISKYDVLFLRDLETHIILYTTRLINSRILFAQPFDQLLTLHNEWQFSEKMKSLGLDVPTSSSDKLILSLNQICTHKNVNDVPELVIFFWYSSTGYVAENHRR